MEIKLSFMILVLIIGAVLFSEITFAINEEILEEKKKEPVPEEKYIVSVILILPIIVVILFLIFIFTRRRIKSRGRKFEGLIKGIIIGGITGLVLGLIQLISYAPTYGPFATPLYNILGESSIFLGILLPPLIIGALIGFLTAILAKITPILAGAFLGLIYTVFPWIIFPLLFLIVPPPKMGGIYLFLTMPLMIVSDALGDMPLFKILYIILFMIIGAFIGFIIIRIRKRKNEK